MLLEEAEKDMSEQILIYTDLPEGSTMRKQMEYDQQKYKERFKAEPYYKKYMKGVKDNAKEEKI